MACERSGGTPAQAHTRHFWRALALVPVRARTACRASTSGGRQGRRGSNAERAKGVRAGGSRPRSLLAAAAGSGGGGGSSSPLRPAPARWSARPGAGPAWSAIGPGREPGARGRQGQGGWGGAYQAPHAAQYACRVVESRARQRTRRAVKAPVAGATAATWECARRPAMLPANSGGFQKYVGVVASAGEEGGTLPNRVTARGSAARGARRAMQPLFADLGAQLRVWQPRGPTCRHRAAIAAAPACASPAAKGELSAPSSHLCSPLRHPSCLLIGWELLCYKSENREALPEAGTGGAGPRHDGRRSTAAARAAGSRGEQGVYRASVSEGQDRNTRTVGQEKQSRCQTGWFDWSKVGTQGRAHTGQRVDSKRHMGAGARRPGRAARLGATGRPKRPQSLPAHAHQARSLQAH